MAEVEEARRGPDGAGRAGRGDGFTGGRLVYLSEVPGAGDARLFSGAKDVISVPEAAELLGVCPQTVRRLVAREEIDTIHVGRCVRITKTALLKFVEEASAR